MKEFEEFIKKRIIRKQHPDKARTNSLIEESNRKYNNLKRITTKIGVDDDNANDIIETCYDIIIGITRAKLLLNGFYASGKGAHEAEVSFLKRLNFNENEIEFINKLRYFRNRILYYGNKFDKEYAKKVLEFLEKTKAKLEK